MSKNTNEETATTKALVSSINRQVGGSDWVLKPMTKYYRSDGITLISETNSNAWFNFPLSNSVITASYYAWTGFNSFGSFDSLRNCNNWVSSSSDLAYYGRTSLNTAAFVNYNAVGWTSNLRLYCVEQP
mgnify:FL=1